ncbi:hypothetical protein [Parabacteroides distasonis]|jgi:hypothetical protein|uniref:hypothetical protein n=1 Tax=Parabacteroides distasonis TaxID=823 RepID=UPI000EFF42E3|nr:hypothetical protein [Parabacteroides distasonis]RHF13168.1 hypothetical protein DW700_16300 [Parabacteroides distasonis]RHF25052.1 hypothetical protein DW692_16240 [Parabacteroides distasonis]
MAGNKTKITDIVGKEAFDQLERLDRKLADTQNVYIGLVKEIGKGLTINPSSLSELNAKIEEYKKNVSALKSTIDTLNKTNDQYKRKIDELIEVNKRYAEAAGKVQNSLDQSSSSVAKESNAISENMKAKQQEVVISQELKGLIDQTLGSREENIRRVAQERTILAQLSKEKSQLNKMEKSGAISTKDAVQKRQDLVRSELLHRESLRELLNILTNETKMINSANDSYQEQSLQLERLRKAYRMLSTEAANSKLGVELQKNIAALDTQVKSVDKSLGQHQRNVGNYVSTWDGMGNAINQLTREFPAFSVSLQTGFLAISNNIPILVDQISRIRKENAALREEGLKGVPVWKQIAKSTLSLNTLLSVGITLLTVYGEDIFEWGKNLLSSSSSAKAASEAQRDLNSSTGDYAKALKNSTSSYGENLVTLRNLQAEWNNLGDDLNKQKQFIIDNASEFKKLDVSVTDVNDAENLLVDNTDAFVKAMALRAQATAAQKLAQEKYAEALQKRIEAENLQKKADEAREKGQYAATAVMQDTRFGVKSVKELAEENAKAIEVDVKSLNDQADALDEAGFAYFNYNKKQMEAARSELESAGIRESSNEEKLKRQQEQIEREAKRREKLEMEAERNIQEARLNVMDEGYKKDRLLLEQSFQKRIDDVKTKGVRVNEQIEAIEAERSKKLAEFDRKISEQRANEESQNRLAIAEKGSLQELDARLDILQLQKDKELREADKTGQDRALIEEKYLKQIETLYNDYGKRLMSTEQSQNEILLSQRQIEINEELNALTKQYEQGIIKKKEYEKQKSDLEHQYAMESLQSQLSILESNLYLFEGDERLEKEKEIARLRVQLSKETSDKIIEDAKREEEERKKVEQAKKRLIQESISAIISIGNSLFQRQIDNVDAEIEANQEEYDAKVETIDALAEKDIITTEEAEARKRAAEEETSRKNKELEKKKAELQTRQAKFQKSIDIAQTIAATARAIMVAYKETGPIAGAIFAAMIAATGAVQLATIIAQPIPKYAHGTDNHPGGLAIVGDGGRSEAVLVGDKAYITPDKPTLLSLPAGAEVVPDLNDPAFLSRFVDNTYWLTHNKKGEPVQIVNNFDAEGIIRANQRIEAAIYDLGRNIKRASDNAAFEDYKRRNMR